MSYLAFYFDQMSYSTICRIDELSYSTNCRVDEMIFDEMSWKQEVTNVVSPNKYSRKKLRNTVDSRYLDFGYLE